MILRNVPILLLLILATLSADNIDYEEIKATNYILQPQVVRQKVPHKSFSKLVYESFSTLNYEVNFELSSSLYMREGALSGEDAYSPEKYGGFQPKCRIYKTDLKSKQYRESSLKSRPLDLILVNKESTAGGVVGTVYTMHEGHEISIVNVNIQNEFKDVGPNYPYWGSVPFSFNELGSFSVNFSISEDVKFLNVGQELFLLSDSSMAKFKVHDNLTESQQIAMKGYVQTGGLMKAEQIEDDPVTKRKRFYTLGADEINIYEIVSDTQVNLAGQAKNFSQDSKLLAAVYDRGLFYVTALDILFVINSHTNQAYDFSIKYMRLNGTCQQMEKFQTALHLSCTYNKINYILEFYALGNDIKVNRYFASEDIQGRAISRRLGLGKLAILTDNDIKIIGYGINKNVLLQYGRPQPQFTFGIKYGLDLLPLKIGTNNFFNTLIIFSANKMALLQIEQVPPELYCEFAEDKVGAEYQILLRFNTSRCSYVKSEQDLFYGNMESLCEISIPIVLLSKQVQMESKHTNIIMVIITMLLIGFVLLIVAGAIKYNRSLEYQFEKMQKQLERARKGYGKKKPVDI